jgi:hypothetical protein
MKLRALNPWVWNGGEILEERPGLHIFIDYRRFALGDRNDQPFDAMALPEIPSGSLCR